MSSLSATASHAESFNALDPRSLSDIQRLSRDNSPAAIEAAARQFEALFLQMVMKSMRDAMLSQGGGLFDSENTKMYQSLLDQQLSSNMAQTGRAGLAEALLRQLSPEHGKPTSPAHTAGEGIALHSPGGEGLPLQAGARPPEGGYSLEGVKRTARLAPTSDPEALREKATEAFFQRFANTLREVKAPAAFTLFSKAINPASPGRGEPMPTLSEARLLQSMENAPPHVRNFVRNYLPHAREASRETGIPAEFMIAQAALETGWGRAVLKTADGRSSHNLFNIKASRSWEGASTLVATTEYAGGRAYIENARFRVYASPADSFRDYARLLKESPRYSNVLGQTDPAGFARSLQEAGYATDPSYARKLVQIISSRFSDTSSTT
jgi:peptidoglycan hydrolase FlgJ